MSVESLSPVARWPMPALIRASIGWHLAAAVAALWVPGAWPWALAAVALNQIVLTGLGLTPRSHALGPNLTRLPARAAARGEVALTIDDGPDREVTPQLLDVLARHRWRATFFCIAERAAAEPALVRDIVARGHSVQNHSYAHRVDFAFSGVRRFEAEIGRAQRTLTELTGQRPSCFRAPAGLRNPLLDLALHRLGLRLVSWTRRGYDTRERDPQRVLARLTRGLAAGDILLLHDGHVARTRDGRPVVLEVLPRLIEACRAAGLRGVTIPEGMA